MKPESFQVQQLRGCGHLLKEQGFPLSAEIVQRAADLLDLERKNEIQDKDAYPDGTCFCCTCHQEIRDE